MKYGPPCYAGPADVQSGPCDQQSSKSTICGQHACGNALYAADAEDTDVPDLSGKSVHQMGMGRFFEFLHQQIPDIMMTLQVGRPC